MRIISYCILVYCMLNENYALHSKHPHKGACTEKNSSWVPAILCFVTSKFFLRFLLRTMFSKKRIPSFHFYTPIKSLINEVWLLLRNFEKEDLTISSGSMKGAGTQDKSAYSLILWNKNKPNQNMHLKKFVRAWK